MVSGRIRQVPVEYPLSRSRPQEGKDDFDDGDFVGFGRNNLLKSFFVRPILASLCFIFEKENSVNKLIPQLVTIPMS